MNTNRTTRIVGLLVAVLISVAINGAMFLMFDAVAQEGALANSGQTPTVLTLEAVSIVAQRS